MEVQLTKEQMIEILYNAYGTNGNYFWSKELLSTHNESQLRSLYSACKNEDNTLRKSEGR